MFRVGLSASAVIMGSTAAMGSTPAPTMIGVERVVIACDFDSTISASLRDSVCGQLVKKAQRLTSLPVSAATAADTKSPDLARLSQQLLLRVKVSSVAVDDRRQTMNLQVTPVRLAMPQGEMEPLQATASLVKVQSDWVLQGPVEAFNTLLGGAPSKLHRPIVSDIQ
ncbi:hypothetical protein H8M03_10085 [Sphingomonas sabuli]|uniref:DUF2066 domain-containing protein n=1 Tax=Sphingomonas sabuli TaxID=2764186 RepID=A0A7G9L157_9SPHN|nr:hypothetical protein [Sphingomonas sabuli]QNM82356.1 hypothetical protein H8M03_10085 [Sphingomonas sabuli]